MYAAMRIIDNCGMLNLNTAFESDPNSTGAYLSAVDYERFLRGDDRDLIEPSKNNDLADPDSIRKAEWPFQAIHWIQSKRITKM